MLPAASSGETSSAFRTIAYNILAATGYPPAVAAGRLAPRLLAAALDAYAPDIVTFSECPPPEQIEEIATVLGMTCIHFPSPRDWPGALLTRFEVDEVDDCPHPSGIRPEDEFTRHWGRARLRLPDGEQLTVHSVHLHPADATVREREIMAVLASIRPDIMAGRAVLLQGDLNHRPDMPEYDWWWNGGMSDTFEPVGGDSGHTFRSTLLMARLDYVWVSRTIADRALRGRPLAEPPFVPAPGTPEAEAWAYSDHIPQFAAIEYRSRGD